MFQLRDNEVVDLLAAALLRAEGRPVPRLSREGLRAGGWPSMQPRATGGQGSGNFGHAGRPGEIGGSAPSGILEAIRQADGGFTYSPATGKEPKTGFALSLHKDRERVIPVDSIDLPTLARYAKDNLDLLSEPSNYLGGWHNPNDGKVYLDVSTIVDSAEEAEKLGREADQLAYFDLAQGKSVDIKKRAASKASRLWAKSRSTFPRRPDRIAAEAHRARAITDGDRARAEDLLAILGGKGSGNFGHAGRPGEVGGSTSSGLAVGDRVYRGSLHDDSPRSVNFPGLVFVSKTPQFAAMFGNVREYEITKPQKLVDLDNWNVAGLKKVIADIGGVDVGKMSKQDFDDIVDDVRILGTGGKRIVEWMQRVGYTGIRFPSDEFALLGSIDEHARRLSVKVLGGPGSGNFGHAGRPGEVGGSAPSGGAAVDDNEVLTNVDTSAEEMKREPLPTSMKAAEDRIRYESKEHLYIFKNGKAVEVRGDDERNFVRLPVVKEEELGTDADPLKGTVLVHNHPADVAHSPADMHVAMKRDVQEMRIVTSDGSYVLKKLTDKWPSADEFLVDRHMVDEAVRKDQWLAIIGKKMTQSEAEQQHFAKVWERMAALPQYKNLISYQFEPK